MTDTTRRYPTAADLQALTDFLDARAQNELEKAGGMEWFLQEGFTLTYRAPRDAGTTSKEMAKETLPAWLADHPLLYTARLASELAHLARDTAGSKFRDYDRLMLWERLARLVLRLWPGHPDLLPAWSDEDHWAARAALSAAPAPEDDPSLPPQLREALGVMGERGRVVELTGRDIPGTREAPGPG